MVKLRNAFLILAVAIFILAKLPDLSTGYDLWVREIMDKDFYYVDDVEELGKIYHSKTFYMPDDSLVEYYWNGNYILVGNYSISDSNKEKYWQYLFQEQENKEYTLTQLRVQHNTTNNTDSLIEDTLFIATSIDSNKDIIITRIIRNNYHKMAYIYGKNYSLEETYKLGAFLLYDHVRKYRFELLPSQNLQDFSVQKLSGILELAQVPYSLAVGFCAP